MRLDGQTWLGRRRWIECRRSRRNNRGRRTCGRQWRRGRSRGRTERRGRHRRLRAESGLVSRLRAGHRHVLRGRLSRHRVSSAGWRSGRVWIGRRVRQRRHRRSRRHNGLGRPRWRRRRRGRTRWIRRERRTRRSGRRHGRHGRHGWSSSVRGARVHEQRALRATQLWRHGSAVQSAPRWRPMSDGMDVSGFLQHFSDTGARLRGATVHAARSFLHHAARVVRRHGHLRVPPGKRLPDRRRVRPHQRRRSHLSIGLTFRRAGQLAATVTLTIVIAGGCGSVNSAGGDAAAGTSGQGGHARRRSGWFVGIGWLHGCRGIRNRGNHRSGRKQRRPRRQQRWSGGRGPRRRRRHGRIRRRLDGHRGVARRDPRAAADRPDRQEPAARPDQAGAAEPVATPARAAGRAAAAPDRLAAAEPVERHRRARRCSRSIARARRRPIASRARIRATAAVRCSLSVFATR